MLLVNPRSGSESPSVDDLAAAAETRGVDVRVLEPGEDAAALAGEADVDTIGVAGGDGSLAAVAEVAIERDVPFVCVPYGTKNHFARDLGLDRNDPLAAIAAFDGPERRVDVGRVDGRLFLNNVAVGAYARLVHRREHHRRRRDALARLRAVAAGARAASARAPAIRRRRAAARSRAAHRQQPLRARPPVPRRARATRRGAPAPVRGRGCAAAELARTDGP